MIERPYDGCGKCLLGVRRLSRMKPATSSPERQREDVLTAAASVGGHIIGWADDWEVSGATDPVTRPKLGPWLRDERGRMTASSPQRWTGSAATSLTA
ncbi:integrase [Streptomyces decoyicus]|uniref:Integrase n=1 Tax=Streptomyces decoyicus TaxID=249567 RepID=A0ABZ1FB33_9ACTN|nr:integrase [Streptomyces decoyicus]WSB67573.1 integrase [Streptomyces decoyicus]